MGAIKVENLTKKFNGFTAVDSINFTVRQGEIFGFLGPNGAGKTTTISMLSTLLQPTSGNASVAGFSILNEQDSVRQSIGLVFQDPSLDDELTAYENLDFHCRIYGMPKEKRHARIMELLKILGLLERKDSLVNTFSGGMKRRLEIARGLLHTPKVLFLDEPTIGLDPQTRAVIWEQIEKLNKETKVTIILTTHYMDEADNLCNRIAIIDHGKIIAIDTPQKLKGMFKGDIISIELSNNSKLAEKLKSNKWAKEVISHNKAISVTLDNAEKRLPEIFKLAAKAKVKIFSVNIHKPTLEDAFLHFTGKTIREEEANTNEKSRLMHKAWRR